MNLVFMLEEQSMVKFLKGFLPRILPEGVHFKLIPHEGKSDLQKSIPRKLRAWRAPNTYFIVVQDQDSADCESLKKSLLELCQKSGRSDALVCIACRELEAWFIGDLFAVERAFKIKGLAKKYSKKKKYRNPDHLGTPSRELKTLVPSYGKVGGAKKMGPIIDIEQCSSKSFQYFVKKIRALVLTSS